MVYMPLFVWGQLLNHGLCAALFWVTLHVMRAKDGPVIHCPPISNAQEQQISQIPHRTAAHYMSDDANFPHDTTFAPSSWRRALEPCRWLISSYDSQRPIPPGREPPSQD